VIAPGGPVDTIPPGQDPGTGEGSPSGESPGGPVDTMPPGQDPGTGEGSPSGESPGGPVDTMPPGQDPGTGNSGKDSNRQNDISPPLTSININPYSWYKMPVLVELNCLDESECKTYYCYDKANVCNPEKVGKSLLITSNDCPELVCSFYIRYYSEDSYGNVEAMQSTLLRVDNKAPVTSYIGPNNGSTVQGKVEIKLSCSDDGSGCKEIKYSVDGSNLVSYKDTIVISSAGAHTIGFFSIDNVGNEELGQLVSFFISNTEQNVEIRNVRVSNVTQNSAKITFETSTYADVKLYYGPRRDSLTSFEKSSGSIHEIWLSGLTAESTYFYRIEASALGKTVYFEGSFKTSSIPVEIKVQNIWISNNAAIISWSTSREASCEFLFGLSSATTKAAVNSIGGLIHEVKLTGLEANKRYFFEIRATSGFDKAQLSGEFYTVQKAKPGIIKVDVFEVTEDLSLKGYSSQVEEGTMLKFVVTLVVGDSENLLSCNFGDGTGVETKTIEGTELNIKTLEFYHGFYIDDDSKEKEYEVSFSLKDPYGEKIFDEKKIYIRVVRAPVMIRLIEPNKKLSKKNSFDLFIEIKDSERKNIKNVYTELYFRGSAINSRFSNGVLTATINPNCAIKNAEYLVVKVLASVEGKLARVNRIFVLSFEPCKLTAITNLKEKTFYVGNLISKEIVSFALEGKPNVSHPISYLKPKLTSGTTTRFLDVNILRDSALVTVNHKISYSDINSLSIELRGMDLYDNEISEKIKIKVEPKNPNFYIEPIILPKKLYALKEEKIYLRIRSLTNLKGLIKINCLGERYAIDEYMQYDAMNDVHEYSIILPGEFLGDYLECNFIANAVDRNETDMLNHAFDTVSTLRVKFVSPSKENFNFSEKPEKIILEITYADGNKIGFNELTSYLTVDGNRQKTVIRKVDNAYVAYLDSPLDFNEHNIVLEIERPLKGRGELTVKLGKIPSASEIGSVLLALICIAVVIYLSYKLVLKIRDSKARLLAEKQKIIAFMKKTRAEYFKRHLSEKEFKERYREAEIKLKALEKKISRKEYLRFWSS
ncbi:MAG: Ig-like domain-containing protein, partial [Candidatus Diapherotrites archaeon]